jgi:hypothetical protein
MTMMRGTHRDLDFVGALRHIKASSLLCDVPTIHASEIHSLAGVSCCVGYSAEAGTPRGRVFAGTGAGE